MRASHHNDDAPVPQAHPPARHEQWRHDGLHPGGPSRHVFSAAFAHCVLFTLKGSVRYRDCAGRGTLRAARGPAVGEYRAASALLIRTCFVLLVLVLSGQVREARGIRHARGPSQPSYPAVSDCRQSPATLLNRPTLPSLIAASLLLLCSEHLPHTCRELTHLRLYVRRARALNTAHTL